MQILYSLVYQSPRSSLYSQYKTPLLASSTEATFPARSQNSICTGFPYITAYYLKFYFLFSIVSRAQHQLTSRALSRFIPLDVQAYAAMQEAWKLGQPSQQGDKREEAVAFPPIRDDPSPTSLQSTGMSSRPWLDQQPTGANSRDFLRLIFLLYLIPVSSVVYLVAHTRPSLDQLYESAVYKFNTYIHTYNTTWISFCLLVVVSHYCNKKFITFKL